MDNDLRTKESVVPMKNTFFILGIIVLLIAGAIFFLPGFGSASPTVTGNVAGSGSLGSFGSAGSSGGSDSGSVQVAQMYVQNGQYIITPNQFKAGVPVKIEADISRMPGCSKSIVISEFGIRKILTSTDNTIEFTPDKAGTFNIACSMNMYRGTFTVLQSDGSKSNYVQQTVSGGTGGAGCSAGGGGCGCGGI